VRTAVACERAAIDHIVALRLRVVPERAKRTFFRDFTRPDCRGGEWCDLLTRHLPPRSDQTTPFVSAGASSLLIRHRYFGPRAATRATLELAARLVVALASRSGCAPVQCGPVMWMRLVEVLLPACDRIRNFAERAMREEFRERRNYPLSACDPASELICP
jgi:hypothetical protein